MSMVDEVEALCSCNEKNKTFRSTILNQNISRLVLKTQFNEIQNDYFFFSAQALR